MSEKEKHRIEAIKRMWELIPPPNPLLPKSVCVSLDEPAWPGGGIRFIQLTRFWGKDQVCNIEQDSDYVEKVEYSPSTTLAEVVGNQDEASGHNIVYLRTQDKNQSTDKPTINSLNIDRYVMGSKIDIKKLLKCQSGGTEEAEKSPNTPLVDMGAVKPYYTRTGVEDRTLVFESRFESGNLFSAIKLSDTNYNLVVQNDVNTSGHTQWFFYWV